MRFRPSSEKLSDLGNRKEGYKVVSYRTRSKVADNWNRCGRLKALRIRSHHDRRFLLKSFEAWKEDWWTTRREWSLVVRAECHNKRQKIEKSQQAESYADKQLIGRVWEKWEVCVQMKHKKGRLVHLAVQQNRLSKVWHGFSGKTHTKPPAFKDRLNPKPYTFTAKDFRENCGGACSEQNTAGSVLEKMAEFVSMPERQR
ncbi:LOW QUALITY PROTEIN: hypothetical protein CRUP_006750, partial [Coryphaenoides rupestris]